MFSTISFIISVSILFLVGRHMYTQLLKNFQKESIIKMGKQIFVDLSDYISYEEDVLLPLIFFVIMVICVLLLPVINIIVVSFICLNFYDVIYDELYKYTEEFEK